MNFHFWLAWSLLASLLTAGAGDRMTMVVSPTVSFAPANLEVRVHVMPDDVNRGLEVIAESGEYYRSSHVQLDGKEAPNNIRVELRSLPGGTYVIRGLITDSAGRTRATARTEAIVVTADRDGGPVQDELGESR